MCVFVCGCVSQKNTNPLTQIGLNARDLMRSLPTHSHFRAPLLHSLSQNIPSTVAAKLFRVSSSHVRNAKRKSSDEHDLVREKYAHGTKRQKTSPQREAELKEFIAGACPPKSGSKHKTKHQYTDNSSLYSAYRKFSAKPLSFQAFYRKKRKMRVHPAGKYFGQFDCSRCIRYAKLAYKTDAELTGEEATDLRGILIHRRVNFLNASIMSSCDLNSSRCSYWC